MHIVGRAEIAVFAFENGLHDTAGEFRTQRLIAIQTVPDQVRQIVVAASGHRRFVGGADDRPRPYCS